MKRIIMLLGVCCMLLLCGCGEGETRTLPDVRILDAAVAVSDAETPTQVPERAAMPVRAPKASESPSPLPSPTVSPEPPSAPSPEPTPDPALCPYVGSRNSEVFHLAGCAQAKRIKTENLVGWESIEAAEAAGRVPCKACFSDKPEKTPKPSAAPKPTPTPEPTETAVPLATPEPKPEEQTEERRIPSEYAYVGSKNSEVYHLAGCSQAGRIRAENLVGWESAEAAERAGRRPCGVCLSGHSEETETLVPATPAPTEEAQPPERSAPEEPGEYRYVGSRNSDKYHLPSCRYAQKIGEENRIGWVSREEAEEAGYSPCKTCDP